MDNILACIDALRFADSVVDHAAWAARRMNATIELLHVIQRSDAIVARHDLSGSLGLAAKSGLMEELVRINEAEARLAREQGKALLAAATARLAGAGDVRQTHRHGGIIETIIEREADAELVVIGKRGASSGFATDHLGSKLERVVRQSIKPVLVAAAGYAEPLTAVVAFDGGASARKALRFASSSTLFAGMALDVVIAGDEDDAHRRQRGQNRDWAQALLAGRPESAVTIIGGRPEAVIAGRLAEAAAPLLVMGAYGHSPMRSMIVGSTTTAMLLAAEVPVLLFR